VDTSKDYREVYFVGSSLKDLSGFSKQIKRLIGYSLRQAQGGGKGPAAKPLHGFGPGVLEIVADDESGTYRGVYVVRLASGVYVLHCFQKKSKHGIKIPQQEIDLIKRRLAEAIEQDKERRS
jgi:phage-related protein